MFYEWLPNNRLMFEGRAIDGDMPFMEILANSTLEILIDDIPVGLRRLMKLSDGNAKVYIYKDAFLGDKSKEADILLFEIPNFFDFPGNEIAINRNGSIRGRFCFRLK